MTESANVDENTSIPPVPGNDEAKPAVIVIGGLGKMRSRIVQPLVQHSLKQDEY